jgi:hypothetical protein
MSGSAESKKRWRENHPEQNKACQKQYQTLNREKYLLGKKNHYTRTREEQAKYYKNHWQTLQGKYGQYRKRSLAKGFSFELTVQQFSQYWQQPCFYCGSEIRTIGIDRVDNDLGYEEGNILPCCTSCNSAKGVRSFDDFMDYLKKLHHRQEELGNV